MFLACDGGLFHPAMIAREGMILGFVDKEVVLSGDLGTILFIQG